MTITVSRAKPVKTMEALETDDIPCNMDSSGNQDFVNDITHEKGSTGILVDCLSQLTLSFTVLCFYATIFIHYRVTSSKSQNHNATESGTGIDQTGV